MLPQQTAPQVNLASLKIKHDRPPDPAAAKLLAESIREVGLLHPIVIDAKHNLVAGRRRVAAAKLLGWKRIPATVILTPDLYHRELATIDENLRRSDLTLLERGERLERRREIYASLGKEDFTRETAKVARVTMRSVQHETQIARKITPAAKQAVRGTENEDSKRDLLALARLPEKQQLAVAKRATARQIPIRAAAREVKRAEQTKLIRALKLPPGKFNVVSADPPWEFDDQLDEGRRLDYPTMSLDEIVAYEVKVDSSLVMPVGFQPTIAKWAADDCVLWLWTTNQHLLSGDAVRVARAWGFTPKNIWYWNKPKMGMGHWGRNQVEPFLLCVRGNPVLKLDDTRNVLFESAREHSRKPEGFWQMVDRVCPGQQRLELFSKERRKGWTNCGAEVETYRAKERA